MTERTNRFNRLNEYFRADIYRRLLPYVRHYTVPMTVVIVITIADSVLALLAPWPLKILIDSALGHEPLPELLVRLWPAVRTFQGYGLITFAVAAGIVLGLAVRALSIGGDYLKSRVNEGMTLRFRTDLFRHFLRLSFSYHDETSVGDSMYRLENDTGFISTLLWGNLRHLLTAIITLVGMAWIVFALDRELMLIALAGGPLLYGAVALYSRTFRVKSKRVKVLESRLETMLQEALTNLRVIKAFGHEEREARRFSGIGWRALNARLQLSLQQNLFSAGLGLITQLSRSLILLIGAFHVLEGHLAVGELLVILSYVGQIHEPMEDVGNTLTDMQISLASAERALEVIDQQPAIRDKPDAHTLEQAQGSVAFEDVHFGYGRREVLHGIDFVVHPGQVVAIVGPTGAGKTSIANLIARFYDPQAGCVKLDGYDLRDLTIRTLRQNIAIVSQEPILFSGTIRDNIAYGRPNAGMGEIISAATAANAHDFISALQQGYLSEIGERGVRLSGGERQRITIARAFLTNAPVLILDEPTASIDARTEQVILNALDNLIVNRTTFIIAHRLSTIRRSDQILVVDHGRIKEHGTHAELIVGDGLYAELYRIQTAGLRSKVKQPG